MIYTFIVFELMMSKSTRDSNKADNNENISGLLSRFPDVVNDKVDTKEFLDASRGVTKLMDKFGKLFAPIRYDMQGSIEKLNTRYRTDMEMNATLQDMVLLDVAIGGNMIITDALLWLTRCLQMIQLFFDKIIDDYKSEKSTEDLVAMLKKSYEESLEPFHGWMAKQLFGLLSRMVPSRTYILQTLANDPMEKEETTIDAINDFTGRIKNNVMSVHKFFEEYGLDLMRK